ncbi:MAG TPA: PQQ-binding-like beta-propeller repeat protein [Phycisphaerae bacterium]|nr:PQQ-binding-like beta-propeller repeat protein [Phycisphaerae bacterium]
MNRLIRTLVLVMLVAGVSGCGEVRPTTDSRPVGGDLEKLGLRTYWDYHLKLGRGESISSIHRIEDRVYCLTSRNRLVALDALTGVRQWEVEVCPARDRVFRPIHFKGMVLTEKVPGIGEMLSPRAPSMPPFDAVLINSASQLLVIDRENGRVARRIPLDFVASCGGATDGKYFYVGDTRGWYYAVALKEAIRTWTLSAADTITAPMVYFGNVLYVGSQDSTLRAIRVGVIGQELGKNILGGPITAGFHVDNRGCFVPCEDNRLYTFTRGLSQRLWDHPFVCRGPLRQPVQVGEKTVFQLADRDKLYAINLVNGQERWSLPRGVQVLAASGGDVYVRDARGRLLVVDEILGTVKNSAWLTGLDVFVGNATDESIWAGGRHGRVVCIRPASAGFVTAEMLRKAAP